MGNYVYENNLLQFFGHEEGSVRQLRDGSGAATGFAYDYLLKDHLGNTRMVLTDERQQDIYPAATLEGDASGGALAIEKNFYAIEDANIVNKLSEIPGYVNNNGIPNNNPNAQTGANSAKMYKLTGDGTGKTGLGITLKVMAGDVIDIFGKSYYNTGNPGSSNNLPTLSILSGLLATPAGSGIAAAHNVTAAGIDALPSAVSGIQALQTEQATVGNNNVTAPRAFINYLFFDERFTCVGHGFSMVGANGVLKDHHAELQAKTAPANGYVYVYCSNESPVNVYFDNIQVAHTRGPLAEETHYYPFGLTMAGISSKATGKLENRYKYNGKELQHAEFSDGSGLEEYDYGARSLNAQLGRWFNVDNKADSFYMFSPYNYAVNNPILFVDPDGNDIDYYVQKKGDGTILISATINLTIVNPNNEFTFGDADQIALKNKIAKDFSGILNTKKNDKGKEGDPITLDIDVSVNLTVVSDVDKAKSSDFIITFVNDIPSQNTSEGYVNPIGLAHGDVATVEAGKRSGQFVNQIISHELGHILGLQHSPYTIMEKSLDVNPDNRSSGTNQVQRKIIFDWTKTLPLGPSWNRSGTTADSWEEMKDFIKKTQ
ncbi:RHS repeat-associated core domain-containing protein [Deminuibacter soli]|uniref:RHS repeat-associated core domain-containing protein n=1 Tax=Deminuibacter soli TaxID=2291815 RepID=A0A3E1NG19_9BACT|nr:RHS repeat-associated core domain-containing protein [Deminuibacter soli]RFM26916.1 hypothetical protein DXN05_18195 [Deminuibacter soli]